MNFKPAIARGIITSFDEVIENIRKLSIISNKFYNEEAEAIPLEHNRVYQSFSKITENSSDKDCSEMVKILKDFSVEEQFATRCKKETAIIDFYEKFRRFRDLVEQKIALPLKQWKQAKQDSVQFQEIYESLLQELDDVRNSVENVRLLRDKMMPEQESEEEAERKRKSASEDFRSLHPYFIVTNSEEHIERLSTLKERKTQALQDQQKAAEENFRQSTIEYKKEIQNIVQESIQTKSFIEWLEEKNHAKLKESEIKMKEEWTRFSDEMEECKNTSKIYAEKHAIYLDIEREKVEKVRSGKGYRAATLLQAHWRGYMARKDFYLDLYLF